MYVGVAVLAQDGQRVAREAAAGGSHGLYGLGQAAREERARARRLRLLDRQRYVPQSPNVQEGPRKAEGHLSSPLGRPFYGLP